MHRKIVFNADPKKTIVFVIYAVYDFDPKKAEPALVGIAGTGDKTHGN